MDEPAGDDGGSTPVRDEWDWGYFPSLVYVYIQMIRAKSRLIVKLSNFNQFEVTLVFKLLYRDCWLFTIILPGYGYIVSYRTHLYHVLVYLHLDFLIIHYYTPKMWVYRIIPYTSVPCVGPIRFRHNLVVFKHPIDIMNYFFILLWNWNLRLSLCTVTVDVPVWIGGRLCSEFSNRTILAWNCVLYSVPCDRSFKFLPCIMICK